MEREHGQRRARPTWCRRGACRWDLTLYRLRRKRTEDAAEREIGGDHRELELRRPGALPRNAGVRDVGRKTQGGVSVVK